MSFANRPLVHPDRKISGMRVLKAWRHFRKLVANKEDTEQVFHITEALKGRKTHEQAWAFIASPDGQRFLAEETDIPAMLDDHARWTDCGPSTVAAHYVAFMRREGLSAAGLVAESEKFMPREKRLGDLTQWYFERLRDTHDLFHILTGYGRDALGEASLLGFTYEQNHNRGVWFIAYAAAHQIRKQTRTRAPIYASIAEGRRLGRAAKKLAHMDVEAVMRMDLGEARAMLGIGTPETYFECLRILEAEGKLGADLMAPAQAQAA
jgi:ubiquinone biosynthesis protein COQ4